MSLNNFLCKHFEKDKDGNVKICNILNGILKIFVRPIIFFPFLFAILISMIQTAIIFAGSIRYIFFMILKIIMLSYIESLIGIYIIIGIILISIKI